MLTYKSLGNNGRLGNQLFQIFSTIGLAKQRNQQFSFPDWDYKKYINLPCDFFNNLDGEDLGRLYLQNYNNFIHIENEVKNWMNPSELIRDEINLLKNKYLNELSVEYVCIGVRRTDYLNYQNVHHLPKIEYYNSAINFIKQQRPNKIIKTICFSDDIEWCKNNLNADVYENDNSSDIVKLFLISHCDHFIIPNSTFHWWGAYLSNKNTNKIVIYPIKWFGNDVQDLHTFNLFYHTWYGMNNHGNIINYPDDIKINFIDIKSLENF
jgi:hypothetical protein